MKVYLVCLLFAVASANYFSYGSANIPHPDKVYKGGEDALLTASNLLIVADGVGGWNEKGIDAGLFSKALMTNANQAWRSNPQYYATNPQQLMAASVQNNNNEGSSTMTIVTMDPNGRVISANLGDSGYKILRRHPQSGQFQVLYQSAEQQHSFNYPYQLASPTSRLAKGDSPMSSAVATHTVQNNDFILLGTDGLFDNVFMRDIIAIIKQYGQYDSYGQMTNKDKVARILAQTGIRHGKDQNYWSPFSEHASKSGQNFRGGKLDDTTVILAQAVLNNGGNNMNNMNNANANPNLRISQAIASLWGSSSSASANPTATINNRIANAFGRGSSVF